MKEKGNREQKINKQNYLRSSEYKVSNLKLKGLL